MFTIFFLRDNVVGKYVYYIITWNGNLSISFYLAFSFQEGHSYSYKLIVKTETLLVKYMAHAYMYQKLFFFF